MAHEQYTTLDATSYLLDYLRHGRNRVSVPWFLLDPESLLKFMSL